MFYKMAGISERSRQIDHNKLGEKYEKLNEIIINQENPEKIEAGLNYYYDKYESPDFKVDVMRVMGDIPLSEKKQMLKRLAGEIINRDMINHVTTGDDSYDGVNGFILILC